MGKVRNLDFAYLGYQFLFTFQTTESMAMPIVCRHAANVNKFVVLIQAIAILYLSYLPNAFFLLDLAKPTVTYSANKNLAELRLPDLSLAVTENIQVAVLEGLSAH